MQNQRKHNNNSRVSNLIQSIDSLTLENELLLDNKSEIDSIKPDILFIEPFYSGSHKQLIDLLHKNFPKSRLITLSGKKWPWRARCSALILSIQIPAITTEKYMFCSSVLSLAELLGLRPDLHQLKKIVYFHENQFIYPIRQIKDRDIQFAYNQITTCLAADEIIFNSEFNMQSLLQNINKIIKLLPDYRPKNLHLKIHLKCKVLYFPVEYPLKRIKLTTAECLTIVWPHRWEFDKAPEVFINVLKHLKAESCNFKVHMLGGHFVDVPDALTQAKETLKENIQTFGFVESREEYYEILRNSDVVVSTAIHEFFGVSMLEATYCGCFPLVPNKLVYPEIYPEECLYKDENDLVKKLTEYCKNPLKAGIDREKLQIDFTRYDVEVLMPCYSKLFEILKD